MQLFATHPCPFRSADYLFNDRVRTFKIALEGMQILSTVFGGPYRPTHQRHPLVLWVAGDRRAANWAFWYVTVLLMNHRRQGGYSGKLWRARRKILHKFGAGLFRMEITGPDLFCNASAYPGLPVHEAYKETLADKWAR